MRCMYRVRVNYVFRVFPVHVLCVFSIIDMSYCVCVFYMQNMCGVGVAYMCCLCCLCVECGICATFCGICVFSL